jgi:lipopolysaccharide heptosyltransferase II
MVAAADAVLRAACAAGRTRTRPLRADIRRILVLRLERIGDLMMALPALHALRQLAPRAQIDLVTGSWNESLARLIAGVDRVETMDARWLSRGAGGLGLVGLARRAWAWRLRHYDVAINLEGDIRSNLLLGLSGARWKAGFDMAGGGPVLDAAALFDPGEHTAANAVTLVATALGEKLSAGAARVGTAREAAAALPRSGLLLPGHARERAEQLLRSAAHPTSPMVGIQVGAGRLVKQWPAERLAAVAGRLVRDVNAIIVLTGAQEDRAAADVLIAGLPPAAGVIDLVGALDLVTLAAVLAKLSLLITPDTGPMHIAAIVETPVVAIFGPATPERWGPLSRQCRIVRVDLPCSPCNRVRRPPERCVGHTPDCLASIEVDDVFGAALSLLKGATAPGAGLP